MRIIKIYAYDYNQTGAINVAAADPAASWRGITIKIKSNFEY
jgi:hypothetical protein